MKVITKGLHFTCPNCGLEGEANTAADFTHVRCCGDDIYSIVCPNCQKQHEIPEENVPKHVKKFIKKNFIGLGKYVD